MLRRVKGPADGAWASCQVRQAKGAAREVRYVDEETRPGGYALVNVAAMESLRGDHSVLLQRFWYIHE